MKVKAAALVLGLAAAGVLLAPVAGFVSSAEAARCVTKRGKGWAWTEGTARFQAWEIVAQLSGNWPIQTDTFRNERYKCRRTAAATPACPGSTSASPETIRPTLGRRAVALNPRPRYRARQRRAAD